MSETDVVSVAGRCASPEHVTNRDGTSGRYSRGPVLGLPLYSKGGRMASNLAPLATETTAKRINKWGRCARPHGEEPSSHVPAAAAFHPADIVFFARLTDRGQSSRIEAIRCGSSNRRGASMGVRWGHRRAHRAHRRDCSLDGQARLRPSARWAPGELVSSSRYGLRSHWTMHTVSRCSRPVPERHGLRHGLRARDDA